MDTKLPSMPKAIIEGRGNDATLQGLPCWCEPRWLSAPMIFLLLLGVLLLTYAPVVKYSYAFMDDYTLLAHITREDKKEQQEKIKALILAGGRPIYMFLLEGTLSQLRTLTNLRWLRC